MKRSLLTLIWRFIATRQIAGAFAAQSGVRLRNAPEQPNIFVTALILGCLSEDLDGASSKLVRDGIAFLLSHKSASWSWNYWRRDDKRSKTLPDDLDDSVAALIALSRHAPDLLDECAWSAITKLLIRAETKPGGPYFTWLVNDYADADWQDVDPAVNASIGYFLKLRGIRLPGLEAYCESVIRNETYESKYYSFIAIAYFMARYYDGPAQTQLRNSILKQRLPDGCWGSPMTTALATASLLRLGLPTALLKKAIEPLERTAAADTWQAEPFFIEENHVTPVNCGAATLSAAFGYEALALYYNKLHESAPTTTAADPEQGLHDEIVSRLRSRLSEQHLYNTAADTCLSDILNSDTGKSITLLPYYFLTAPADKRLVTDLGYANLCGWFAYTVYDDVMDEKAHTELIPLANLCLRETVSIYSNLLPRSGLPLFHSLMDAMDAANARELAQRRPGGTVTPADLPDYGDLSLLADKSLPHVLGSLVLLLRAGYTTDSPAVTGTLEFFKHYLSARQLNDDAHDWLADLELGYINPVAAAILRRFFALPANISCTVHTQRSALQNIFWNKEIYACSTLILSECCHAKAKLKELPDCINIKYLSKLLAPLEAAARGARRQTDSAKKFIVAFEKQKITKTL